MEKIGFFSLLVCSILISLLVGAEDITFIELFSPNELQKIILFSLRIPRTLSLLLAGATLAVSGVLMQQLTQNKFVSPTTAGTMDSARLGIILSMILFNQSSLLHKTLFAFIFSIAGTLIFVSFLNSVKLKSSIMIPLVGLMYGNVVGAIGTFLAYQHDLIQNATAWLQGNFSLISSNNYQLIFLVFPLMIIIYLFSHYFSVMNLGKDQVTSLGVPFLILEILVIIIISIATSAVILTAGNVPFIGVIIPNLISMKQGDHFKKVLFPTAYFGGLFLVVCDIFARVIIAPYEVPVSLIVGIIGTGLFLFLLLKGEQL
ncbi:ABC transporter permease [Marinilactibacillus psychrotolerans]|uniref:Iron ABC transporter permease protein n=1 Tax=Marinilactibacillus psychrotolerans TaxID=191770 RepID=A0AAV3WNF2_9LACT|nr:iron chelate uptake ABC transporter family permease subunit [Marinilactibacillus psychrotolerans]GEL66091.1 iron ABC transporter permease [Marinilactibacillus psychrotolerans]GEQ34600.1 iron ABC transporter permease protein [Marinilactibacillus psychrotolerans]SDB98279.1 iron complex transport system permease protein [Marinilactibacillus psychrotolerans]